MVVPQAELTPEKLVSSLAELYENRETFRKTMSESTQSSGVDVILGLIDEITGTAPKKE